MSHPLRRRSVRYAVGVLTAIVGFVLTAGLLMALQKPLLRDDAERVDSVAFDTPPPPKKPPAKRKPKPKPKPRPKPSKAPPPPSLGSALAGLSFGLPQFSGDLLGGASDSLLGQRGDAVMPEDAVDEPPRPTQRTGAAYPTRARAQNVEGFVTLSLLVQSDGSVSDIRVLEAQPPGVFEQAAMESVRGWRFEPALYEERPVAVRARQTIHFRLGD